MSKKDREKNFISPPMLNESMNESLNTSFFSLGDWPKENWWELFDSPQLNQFITESLENNPSLQEVRSRFNKVTQESIITRATLYPWVSFETDYSHEYLSQNGLYRAFNSKLPLNANLMDIFLKLQYECDFWDKNRNRYLAALGRSKAKQAEVAQSELLIAAAVTQAYVSLKVSLIRQTIFEQLNRVALKTLQLQNLLKNSALENFQSVLSLKESYLQTEQNLFKIQEQISLEKHLLNILLGRGPDEELNIDATLPYLPETLMIPSNLSTDLLARRPDLTAQIWQVEALSHEVGAAIAEFYPDINFSLLIGLESVSMQKIFDPSSRTTTFAPALHLPIFTAGAIEANVRAIHAAFDEAVFAYNKLLLSSAQEVADILSVGISVNARKIEQGELVNSVKQRLELAIQLKTSGLKNAFDVYLIQTELLNQELKNIDLIYAQYVTGVQLIKALGGGYHQ